MRSILSLLQEWNLKPNLDLFEDFEFPLSCQGECTHDPINSIEDFLESDITSFGPRCPILLKKGSPAYDLFRFASLVVTFSVANTENAFGSEAYLLLVYPSPAFVDLEAADLSGHIRLQLIRKMKENLPAIFEHLRESCGPRGNGKVYDPSEPLFYLKFSADFFWMPRLVFETLYGALDMGPKEPPILKLPLWVLSDSPPPSKDGRPSSSSTSPKGLYLITIPVTDIVPVEPDDDDEFVETFKVLSREMDLEAAAKAARALR